MTRSLFSAFILLVISLLNPTPSDAQALFERGFGTPEHDEAYALCKTSDGGYAVAGYTQFYNPTLTNKPFIVKFNHDGQFVWSSYVPTTRHFTATGITEDATGNLYVCATGPYGDSILVSKLSSTGAVLWAQMYGGPGLRTANELMITSAGNILVAGSQSQTSPTKTNAFILNIDANGGLLGEKVYSSAGTNSFLDMINTYDGNFVFCSKSQNGNDHYAYLVKTNINGDSLWTRTIFIVNHTNPNALDVSAITEISNHELVIAGSRNNGSTYNKAYFLQLSEDATTVITTAGSGISNSLADGITDLATGELLTDEVYGSNRYQNFGSHFSLLLYDNQTYSVSPNFQYLNLSAYSFSFHQAIRGPARAIVNDTDLPIYLDNNVIAGSTKLSGYGKMDFALVKTDESFASLNSPTPIITLHGPNSICPGDSTLITLDANQQQFHHWANLIGTNTNFDLGVSSDSLWVYEEGLYACIAFDADSSIYVSNIVGIGSPDTTVTISNSGPLNFCSASGESVLLTSSTQIPSPAYQWFVNGTPISGATASSYTATQSGSYHCQVTSGCGISTSNIKVANAGAGPTADVFNYSTAILTNCTGTIGFNQQPNEQYRWYNSQGILLANTTPTITPLNPGWYSGVAYNACGTDSVTFYATEFLYPAPAHFNGSPTILNCSGFPIDLEIMSSSLGFGPYNITWELNGVPISGANSSIYSATQPGTYGVTFEDPLCMGSQNYQYCIIQDPVAVGSISITASDTINCTGDTATVQAPLISGVDYTWVINGIGNNTPDSLNLKVPYSWGTVTLTLQISNGCSTYLSNQVTIVRDYLSVNLPLATGCASACNAILNPQINFGYPPNQFLWSTGAITPQLNNVCNTTVYTVTVTDSYGCSDSDWYNVNQSPLATDSLIIEPVCGYCNGAVTYPYLSGGWPLQYSWSNGNTADSITGLCENDTWAVTITDNNSCNVSYSGIFPASCDSVWPGDADDNGIVENLDLFPIGLYYGATGPVRNNASLIWVGQPAPLWGLVQSNGSDFKYADTDGNGTINGDDTLAINLNFNQTHSPFAPPQSIDPDITAVFSSDTVYTGQPIQIQLILGSGNQLIQDIYGIAYTVSYDNQLAQSQGVYFDQAGWFVPGTGLELIKGNSTTHQVFASAVRTNQTDTSGFGPLATFGCLAAISLPPGSGNYSEFDLTVSNIMAIDHSGNMTPLNSLDTALVITDIPTGILQPVSAILGVHPNPTSGSIQFTLSKNALVELCDHTGRVVASGKMQAGINRMHLENYASGVYFLRANGESKPVKILLNR
jgi:Secretion system C-terminal sorting domain